MNRRAKFLKKLIGEVSGATAVELGLIVPTLILAIMGSLQVSYIGFAQNRLETAVRDASRTGLTGGAAISETREDTIIAAVTEAMQGVTIATGAQPTVEARAYPSYESFRNNGEYFQDNNPQNGICDPGETYIDYNNNNQRDTGDISQPGFGGSNDVVQYTITYPMKLTMPIARDFFGDGQKLDLVTRTVIRNEQFSGYVPPPTRICHNP